MSDSITPWLLSYLTLTAESYGARIENVTRYEKKKKVQIIEFLTYGSEAQDACIWARVSDKQYSIPVKFSKEAVSGYVSTSHNTRLTQHKGAIVSIKNFRPMLSRLPCGPGGTLTATACLALECDYIFVLGSSGEGTFGSPAHITNNVDMHAWSEGLNQAGGAGNILKNRRNEQLEQEDIAESSTSAIRPGKSLPERMLPPPVPVSKIAPRPPSSPRKGEEKTGRGFWVGYRTSVTDMASYHARWKAIASNPYARFRPDENSVTTAKVAELPASTTRSRSATPLVWESSPEKSYPVSSLSMPTPGQRQKRHNTPQEMASSSPLGDETKLDIEPPISQSQSVSRIKQPVARKVPRPMSPKSVNYDGPARVLVPNSDTSGTQSQSQSQSQSQPHVHAEEIFDIEGVNEESLASQQARNANLGVEEINEDEKGEDEHAAMEAGIIDEEAPRGREALSAKAGPKRSESAGTRTRVNGNTREGTERGVAPVDEDEQRVAGEGGDMDEAMEVEEGREERWPWMNLWAVRAVAAATREARLVSAPSATLSQFSFSPAAPSDWRHLLVLTMSLSLGGLGLVSLRNPFKHFLAVLYGKGDLRSMFCLIVFVIISFVLAYLTNPTENSFRAYLTEQSFRHHLSRLDENADDPSASVNLNSRYAARNSSSSAAHNLSLSDAPPFHFANRASIALRTPKHVFHSFAIFTIAAMVPLSKPSDTDSRDWMISDSWYIGAFGKWWRGGVLEAWYQDVIARSKDEESWSAGILTMKRLDMIQDCNGPTFSAKNLPSYLTRGSPPKLRNRERPIMRNSTAQSRSSTPPPLPKSVSLPMHTIRKPSSNADRTSDRPPQIQQPPHVQPSLPTDAIRTNGSSISRSPSAVFEHSPAIVEVLRQISNTKATVVDLHTQLSDCENAASQSRALLQLEVDTHRERKRQEDAAKLKLKAQTKSLEESKRAAESLKREADKKLKSVQTFRDNAAQRVEFIDKSTVDLQQRLLEDQAFIANHRLEVSDIEREIATNLDQKRQEIKEAEEMLLLLNHRSRELEEKLASEKDRLGTLREETTKLKQSRALVQEYSPLQASHDTWPSNLQLHNDHATGMMTEQGRDSWDSWNHDHSIILDDAQFSHDTLGGRPAANSSPGNTGAPRENQVTVSQTNSFSPFGEYTHNPYRGGQVNGTHSTMDSMDIHHHRAKDIPSHGLLAPSESERSVSRSFQSDSDPYVDRDWRQQASMYPSQYQNEVDHRYVPITSSPTSMHPALNSEDRTFEPRFDTSLGPSNSDISTAWVPKDLELPSFLDPQGGEYNFLANLDKGRARRWLSGFGRDKASVKGLNPDAKEFNILQRHTHGHSNGFNSLGSGTYDALNPNGLGSTASASSNSQSLLRAFAPSPAEREALQRVLGGSTNASFERLPSLSDVGSIPASPTSGHVHALPPQLPANGMGFGSIFPAWLQALPKTRKVNFSPWDDEEDAPAPAKATNTTKTAVVPAMKS